MEISSTTITPERVQNAIYVIRGERVMLIEILPLFMASPRRRSINQSSGTKIDFQRTSCFNSQCKKQETGGWNEWLLI
jgi:hypothetical protein